MNSDHYCTITLLVFSFVAFLLPQPTTATPVGKGFTFELIHRESIHSPLYPGNLTAAERLRRLVQFSESRTLWLESSIIRSQDVNIRPALAHDAFLYMVKVGIGSTPPTDLYLLMDTGSNLVWTQSEPCNPCFPQDGAKYKPSGSRTFLRLPCNHPFCVRPYQCVSGLCAYEMRYATNAFTRGILATDHFSLASRTGRIETIPGVVFGCSRENSNPMFKSTKLGGIFGMGSRQESFAMQLASRTQHDRFSYCLVPTESSANSYLRFGTDIPVRGNAQSTPFLRTNTPYYYLILMDISVNGQRLNLPAGTFTLRPNGSGGCMIDSGAEVTFMIAPAYNAMKRSLVEYFRRFNLTIVSGSELGLDLCYRMPPGNFTAFPSMDFHFQGANLHLEKNNLFKIVRESMKFCLAMTSEDRFTVIGAAQQQNIQFVYDVGRQRLYFAPENCARS